MSQNKPFLFLLFCLLLVSGIFAALPGTAHAQQQNAPILIRDTEIENTFKAWMAPLLEAANMAPESVKLILVQSPDVNAFVAGGANIFIYTGLIEKSENPEEIIGVLAHELGHVVGSHLIAGRDAMERASYESILGTVLGIGAAILTGNGGAGNAIMAGTSSMAQRRYLAHSRVHESSADQAAVKFLNGAKVNPQGLSSFLEKLASQEFLPASQQSEYVRTHPITRNRIDALENNLSTSPYKDSRVSEDWYEQHRRMKAKLLGFIDPGRVPWVYSDSDKSIPARYARAIAAYKKNEVAKALDEIDGLLEIEPENPYFLELKGQMLMGFGKVKEAVPFYRKSVSLTPKAGLIRIDLGRALMESGEGEPAIKEAIKTLEQAKRDEPRSTRVYRLLATAYGRLGNEDMAKLYLAEEAVLQGRFPYARTLAEAALKNLKKDTPEALRAQDLLEYIDTVGGKGANKKQDDDDPSGQ